MLSHITTSNAPSPMGPFSQAIVAGNFVFVSAQLALDPSSSKMMMDNIETETKQVMENIGKILAAAGVGFNDVVKCSIFLKDMQDYSRMNSVYSSYFNQPFPARETIEVAGLPANVNIEISAIAVWKKEEKPRL